MLRPASVVILLVLAAATAHAAETDSKEPDFSFGSYGRFQIGSDLNGRPGRSVNVVSFGPRLVEPSYQELDFYYRVLRPHGDLGTRARLVVGLALGEEAFHYTGKFEATLALRNMYVETDDIFLKDLSLWAGSRSYRGDDIHLLDFWPLDNLNTLGGGAQFKWKGFEARAHFGVNRIDNDYQLQILSAPVEDGIGSRPDVTLERQRSIASFRLSYEILSFARARLYTERHDLPPGEQVDRSTGERRALPRDSGWVLGGQVTAWNKRGLWGSLFAKLGTGLGAYGEMSRPNGLSLDRSTTGARLGLIALTGAWEQERFAIPAAIYFSSFSDATGSETARDYEELAFDFRPVAYLTERVHLALDFSYQLRAPHRYTDDGVSPFRASVTQIGLMPMIVPGGRGLWTRPAIRFLYAVRFLSDDARTTLFPETDVRYGKKVGHYLGVGVEWWFNSSYDPD